MMAFATASVPETMIGDSTLGRMCRRISRREGVPMERAARMNSRSFRARISPRTMRATGIHEVSPMTQTMRMKIPASVPNLWLNGSRKSMMMTSRSGRTGRARNRSVSRIRMPASTPMSVPSNSVMTIATRPTASEMRPPNMTCAMTSCPSCIVPMGCARLGAVQRLRVSSAPGSTVQIYGPTVTKRMIATKQNMPAMAPRWCRNWYHASAHWLRGASVRIAGAAPAGVAPEVAATFGRSVIADPRVKDAVKDIRDQVERHDEHSEDEADGLHHRHVGPADRLDQLVADAVDAKDLLGDQRAAEDRGHVERDDRHDGDQRVAQDMAQNHDAFSHALGAGGAHVILLQVVEHGGAHVAADLRGVVEAQHHHRQDHLTELEDEAVPVVDDMGGRVTRWQPPPRVGGRPDREDDNRHRSGEEGRDREADHGKERRGLIGHGILLVGRDYAQRHTDQDTDDVGGPDHPQRLR